jgi:shikimate dehydrogenase
MNSAYNFGLVGWPLNHSLSPQLHMAALQAIGWSGSYCLCPIPLLPAGNTAMAGLLQNLRDAELDGLNVTIPHKVSVVPLLDELSPIAREIGAVNTINYSNGNLVGENTDASGFLQDILPQLSSDAPGEALVLGAGGGARAVVYTLASRGWQVFVVSRDPARARKLVADFAHLKPTPISLTSPLAITKPTSVLRNLQLLVNATALGMPPLGDCSPWPVHTRLPESCFVYDLVYNPSETMLLRQAKVQGLMTSNGLGMLVNQAALSFMIWTNLPKDMLTTIQNAMQAAISIPSGPL